MLGKRCAGRLKAPPKKNGTSSAESAQRPRQIYDLQKQRYAFLFPLSLSGRCCCAEVEKRGSVWRAERQKAKGNQGMREFTQAKKTCAPFSHTYHCRGVSRAHPAFAAVVHGRALRSAGGDFQPTVNTQISISFISRCVKVLRGDNPWIRHESTVQLVKKAISQPQSPFASKWTLRCCNRGAARQKLVRYVYIWAVYIGINFADSPAPISRIDFPTSIPHTFSSTESKIWVVNLYSGKMWCHKELSLLIFEAGKRFFYSNPASIILPWCWRVRYKKGSLSGNKASFFI